MYHFIKVIPAENVSLYLGNHKANPNYSKNDSLNIAL